MLQERLSAILSKTNTLIYIIDVLCAEKHI